MNSKLYFLILFLTCISITSEAQIFTKNNILKLELHPSDESLFIAKLYNKETGKLIEYWDMTSSVTDITSENFNELRETNKIVPNGKYYHFYPNRKLMAEINYKMGVRKGEYLGFYDTGEPKFKGNYNHNLVGQFIHFYKNGNISKRENFSNGNKHGESINYFLDGNIRSELNYENGIKDGTYTSFYSNGKTKRKVVFRMNRLKSTKCFNSNGKKTDCTPFLTEPEYPDGFAELQQEIDKIDFSWNKSSNDSITCQITLLIDTQGKAELKGFYFHEEDTLKSILPKWVSKLPLLSPVLLDDTPVNYLVDLKFPVCGDSVMWLSEISSSYKTFRNTTNQEDYYRFQWSSHIPTDNRVFQKVEKMPVFPGGELELRKFIARNLKYPTSAMKTRIGGKVYANFIIDPTGQAVDFQILKSVHPVLDKEALRVLKLMPNWKPGTKEGKPVSVSYTVPINFILNRKMAPYKMEL